jgi:hypothetical protein
MTASQSPERTATRPQRPERTPPAAKAAENVQGYSRRVISELSNEQIESMSEDDLFRLIRASEHPWDDGEMERHAVFADRRTLLQLAYLARNCCRNAECAAHDQALMDELHGPLNRRDAGTLFGSPR